MVAIVVINEISPITCVCMRVQWTFSFLFLCTSSQHYDDWHFIAALTLVAALSPLSTAALSLVVPPPLSLSLIFYSQV